MPCWLKALYNNLERKMYQICKITLLYFYNIVISRDSSLQKLIIGNLFSIGKLFQGIDKQEYPSFIVHTGLDNRDCWI